MAKGEKKTSGCLTDTRYKSLCCWSNERKKKMHKSYRYGSVGTLMDRKIIKML